MFLNIVIGKPLVEPSLLLAYDQTDWEENEEKQTFFTETHFLPSVLKEAGIVSSTSEVRRNQPKLCVNLTELDCFWLKWGKKKLYIIVGE